MSALAVHRRPMRQWERRLARSHDAGALQSATQVRINDLHEHARRIGDLDVLVHELATGHVWRVRHYTDGLRPSELWYSPRRRPAQGRVERCGDLIRFSDYLGTRWEIVGVIVGRAT